jgi:hypothetical protein
MRYKIPEIYPAGWGTYGIVNIQNRLLELGYNDPLNYKFVFVSGTCIPLHSFDYIYNYLMNNENSYMGWNNCKNHDHKLRFNQINNIYKWDINSWKVASQWSIINRDHCKFILDHESEMKEIFNNSFTPDEHAYINIFSHHNFMNNITHEHTTYTNWNIYERSTNWHDRPLPKTYNNYELKNESLINIKKDHLFMRKIGITCYVNTDIIFNDNI